MPRLAVRLLFTTLLVLVASAALAGEAPARVIGGAGSFVKVTGGWRCGATQQKYVPPVLSGLQVGDIVVRIGKVELASQGPLVFAEAVRQAELGLVSDAIVLRNGERVRLIAPPEVPDAKKVCEVVVSQAAPEILRSTFPQLLDDDRIEAIGGKSWAAIENAFRSAGPMPLVNMSFKAPTTVSVVRDGKPSDVAIQAGVTLVGVRLPKFVGDEAGFAGFLDDVVLRGLNTPDVALKSTHGRWLLVHFWASWCRPCVLEAPSIAELARRKDLTVVAVGYADTIERLAEFGAKTPGFPVYAPDAVLTSEMAVNGVPFDVLVNPEGRAVAVVSGTLPEGLVGLLARSYLEPEVGELAR